MPSRTALISALVLGACSTPREIASQAPPQRAPEHGGVRYVFYLLHANADEIASTLTELLQASRRATSTRNIGYCALMTPEFWAQEERNAPHDDFEMQIVADPRMHSILVIPSSDENDDVDRIAELIHRLDEYVAASHWPHWSSPHGWDVGEAPQPSR